MARFTVVSVESAQNELAELWLTVTDRTAITDAAQVLDRELSRDAADKGSELSDRLRALFVPQLKAIFAVRDDDRIVEVPRIRTI